MRKNLIFGLLLLGIIVVAIAPLDANAGDWAIRLFTWSRAPSQPVVVYQGTYRAVDCSGAVLEVAPTCSGAAFYLEAATCAGFAGADADDDEDADDDNDD